MQEDGDGWRRHDAKRADDEVDAGHTGRQAVAEGIVHMCSALTLLLNRCGPWSHLHLGWLQAFGEVEKQAAGLRNSQGTEWPTTQRGPASHQRFAEQAHSRSGLPSGNRGIPGVGYLSHCASALTAVSAISANTDAIACRGIPSSNRTSPWRTVRGASSIIFGWSACATRTDTRNYDWNRRSLHAHARSRTRLPR